MIKILIKLKQYCDTHYSYLRFPIYLNDKIRFYYFEICRSSRIEYYIVDTLNVKGDINFKKASQYEIYKITKFGTRIYI